MKQSKRTKVSAIPVGLAAGLALAVIGNNTGQAYERYNGGCQTCHGSLLDSTSPQGTQFPSGDKHRMHRNTANMGTDCDFCHTHGDNDDPFIGSSDGIGTVPGLGCNGCHVGSGCASTMQLPAPLDVIVAAPVATAQAPKQRPRRT